jgi:hypothetical protein
VFVENLWGEQGVPEVSKADFVGQNSLNYSKISSIKYKDDGEDLTFHQPSFERMYLD